jgi:hypothetical protein
MVPSFITGTSAFGFIFWNALSSMPPNWPPTVMALKRLASTLQAPRSTFCTLIDERLPQTSIMLLFPS